MKNFEILWNFFSKKDKFRFNLLIFFFIIQSLLEVIGIASVIPFITVIFNPESLSSITFLDGYANYFLKFKNNLIEIFCVIFLGIFILKNLSLIWINKFKNNFVNYFKAELSKKILLKYFKQDFLFFSKNKQGKLATVINEESKNLTTNYLDSIIILISEVLIISAVLFLIIITGHYKGLVIIIPILLLASIVLKSINKKVKYFSYLRVEIAENLATLTQRIFIGIRDVFLSNNGNDLAEKVFIEEKKQAFIDSQNSTYSLMPKAILEVIGLAVLLVFVIYFEKLGVQKDIIISNLAFYFVIAYRTIPSYNKILIQYQRINYAINSLRVVNEVFNMENKRSIESKDNQAIDFKKNLTFKHISFSYNLNKSLFRNIDLTINKGEIIGICGESGSGKSTLLNLITQLIKQDKGDFYLDEKIITSHENIKEYQDIITFTSQDTFLIEDTIKKNILFYPGVKQENKRLEYAIKFALVDKFIDDLEGGLNYRVGSHSRRISSGQRQRIAIARAIYNAKDILIFDEATNALDYENEKKIIQNIVELKNKHTVILVSHEMRNLKECDVVYEIKDNKIKKILND